MIDAHRGAFEYDWRSRFHLPLKVIGKSMTWGEAIRLTRVLSLDPASAISAAVNDFDRPVSRDALVLMDLYDLQGGSKYGRKHTRYPRPWGDKSRKRTARPARLSPAQLRLVLDAHRSEATDG